MEQFGQLLLRSVVHTAKVACSKSVADKGGTPSVHNVKLCRGRNRSGRQIPVGRWWWGF